MMSNRALSRHAVRPAGAASAAVLILALCLGACMHMLGTGVPRPNADVFGYGPRASQHGEFRATIEPANPLVVGRIQSVVLRLEDASGTPVPGATIDIDGGMPQHGHGLPTKPRVTAELAAGAYRVDGLKFNMGGWWELRFAIATDSGVETIVFNLSL
jgi:YtkA-like